MSPLDRRRSPARRTALRALAAGLGWALSARWARADKPDGVGSSKEKRGREPERRAPKEARGRPDPPSRPGAQAAAAGATRVHFGSEHRRIAGEFYAAEVQRGHCPPGLARKGKGCMPPGQARKWTLGAPLPRDLVVYELPVELRVRLPLPPSGYRYVQIAGDILLIAIGTRIVVDALEDLLR